MVDNYSWRRRAREKALFFVIFLFAAAIWLSLPMFIRQSDLTRISGSLDTAYLNISTVSSTHERYGVSNTSYSQKATLAFRVKGIEQTFSIAKNIGDQFDDETYSQILTGLKEANIVSVWIKKRDSLETYPDVWQIYSDETPLVTLAAAKGKDMPIVSFMFALGFLGLGLIMWSKNREKQSIPIIKQ